MSHLDQYDPDELLEFEVSLDIPSFVRAAVKKKFDRDTILLYLYSVAETPISTPQMKQFFPIAQEMDLNRNEILIWLHLSYGGSPKPKQIRHKLRIPPRFVEKALTVLEEKGIIKNLTFAGVCEDKRRG